MAMGRETLDTDGFLILGSGLSDIRIGELRAFTDALSVSGAGTRNLLALPWCEEIAAALRGHLSPLGLIDASDMAVQCTLFSKTASLNWKVALHQDLAIPVATRVEHAALSGWSAKEGGIFVQPPARTMRKMLAVRLHLDACGVDDGPLRVVPRSHRYGRLEQAAMRRLDEDTGRVECTAERGELLLMRPLLLHASSKAEQPSGARKVLHFLFGPPQPGFGLQWSISV